MMLLYGETRHSDACKVRYKTGDDRDLFVVILVLFIVQFVCNQYKLFMYGYLILQSSLRNIKVIANRVPNVPSKK